MTDMTEMAHAPQPHQSPHQTGASPSPRLSIPGIGTYRERLTVRSYETGPGDIVRPATLMRYMEHMATRASAALGHNHTWYEERGEAFVVNRMRLRLASPARMDQNLACATWVVAYRRALATRDYAIWHADTGQPVARASARWAYIDVNAGRPRRVPDLLMEHSGSHGHEMPPNPRLGAWVDAVPPEQSEVPTYSRAVAARGYEADTRTHVNNCVYVDWLEDAFIDALRGHGLPADRYRAREMRIDYMRQAWPGDALTITTRLLQPAHHVVIAYQDISAQDGTRVVQAASAYLRLLACPPLADVSRTQLTPPTGETAPR